ncbi:MAG TPA: CpsB/CapC family capsule biosynthesis tyrosine phosphatase [Kofleriaceae bacterium]|nr:CpsB/CapC family capsule biosynthesis tyrosine phosphatase [Kofleriaceae bacterium]
MGFADLHSHILPGIDDGAQDLTTTVTMVRGLVALGFDTITATPHQKAGQFFPSRPQIDSAYAAARTAIADAGITVTVPLAAENMWDSVFHDRVADDTIPGYGDGPAFLFELPIGDLPVGLTKTLFRLRARGLLPVLAHPERYPPLLAHPDLAESLAQSCPLVVDLGAVAGYHGRREGKLARKLLSDGIAHAVASDAHGPGDVSVAAAGIRWIKDKLGSAVLTRLLDENPRHILAGQFPEA